MRPLLRSAVRAGAIAGIVTIFLAAVGLIGDFTDLNLIGHPGHVRRADAPARRRCSRLRRRRAAGRGRRAIESRAAGGARRRWRHRRRSAGVVFGAVVVLVTRSGSRRSARSSSTSRRADGVSDARDLDPIAGGDRHGRRLHGRGGAGRRPVSSRGRCDPRSSRALRPSSGGAAPAGRSPIALDQLDVERDWLYSKITAGLTWVGGAVVYALTAAAVRFHVGRRLAAILLPTGTRARPRMPARRPPVPRQSIPPKRRRRAARSAHLARGRDQPSLHRDHRLVRDRRDRGVPALPGRARSSQRSSAPSGSSCCWGSG